MGEGLYSWLSSWVERWSLIIFWGLPDILLPIAHKARVLQNKERRVWNMHCSTLVTQQIHARYTLDKHWIRLVWLASLWACSVKESGWTDSLKHVVSENYSLSAWSCMASPLWWWGLQQQWWDRVLNNWAIQTGMTRVKIIANSKLRKIAN